MGGHGGRYSRNRGHATRLVRAQDWLNALFHHNFFAWLTIVDELYTLEPMYKDHRSEWGHCSDTLRSLNDTRVRLAHHTVWDHPSENATGLRPGRLDVRTKSRKHGPLTDAEIMEFTGKVLDIGDRLGKLLEAMRSTKHAVQQTFLEKYSLLKLGQTIPEDAQQLRSDGGLPDQPQPSQG